MKTFKKFLQNNIKRAIIIESSNAHQSKIEDWGSYVNGIPMLKKGVELMKMINEIGNKYNVSNPRTYIVGGTIRDIITGEKKPDDIDIATNVPIDILDKELNTHDIGKNKDFGILVANYKDEDFEIANFRKDGTYSDGRRPDEVEIVFDFKEDAKRRDFTINAMGVDEYGNIIDYFDGHNDIKNKTIKTVGNPTERFEEDYIRMLRGIRFASRLGFKIDDKTMEAIKSNSDKIASQAKERIMKEVIKMAKQSGSKFANAILLLKDSGLLKYIFPEVLEMDEFEHSVEHHPEGNVFQHTIEALKQNDLDDYIINLAILLHDVGKIKTHSIDEKGLHRYLGHAKESHDMIEKIAKRLKMTSKEKDALMFAAGNHMKFHEILKMSNNKILKLMDSPYWNILYNVARADTMSRKHKFDQEKWNEIVSKLDTLKNKYGENKVFNEIKKIVNGKLIIKLRPDIKKGPDFGEIISDTISWIVDNNISIQDSNSIINYIKNWKS